MINVLLLGVGGNVSQGILKAVKQCNIETRIIGACISSKSLGLYMCDEGYLCPYASDDRFMDWLIDICNSKKIDIVITGVEENIIKIAQNIDYFKQHTRAIFISSSYDQLCIGQDKYLTCEWLKEHNCNYPAFCKSNDMEEINTLVKRKGFPLIAKPCHGKSASGIFFIKSPKDLESVLPLEGYVLEEYIGESSDEYTVGCYCDKNGKLVELIIMQRILKNGTTVYAKVVDDIIIKNEAMKICEAYKPVGPFNIQLRKNKQGQAVCFELNVRFSGTTAMRSNFGFKDVEAMLREYVLNESIDACFNNIVYGEAFRFDSEMYIYGDASSEMEKKTYISDMNRYNVKYGIA